MKNIITEEINKSRRPHKHLNQHTEKELNLIARK